MSIIPCSVKRNYALVIDVLSSQNIGQLQANLIKSKIDVFCQSREGVRSIINNLKMKTRRGSRNFLYLFGIRESAQVCIARCLK